MQNKLVIDDGTDGSCFCPAMWVWLSDDITQGGEFSWWRRSHYNGKPSEYCTVSWVPLVWTVGSSFLFSHKQIVHHGSRKKTCRAFVVSQKTLLQRWHYVHSPLTINSACVHGNAYRWLATPPFWNVPAHHYYILTSQMLRRSIDQHSDVYQYYTDWVCVWRWLAESLHPIHLRQWNYKLLMHFPWLWLKIPQNNRNLLLFTHIVNSHPPKQQSTRHLLPHHLSSFSVS